MQPGLLGAGHVRGGLGRRARAYRPLLDRIRGSAEFADLLWEVVGELGTSHAYVQRRPATGAAARPRWACSARTSPATPPAAGWWTGCCPASPPTRGPGRRSPRRASRSRPATSWWPWTAGRSTRCDGPWPLLAGTAGKPVELTVRLVRRTAAAARGWSWCRCGSDRRLRYQDWVASRRRLVRELSDGRLGYLHIPDMMGEGWAHFHRDLRTEMAPRRADLRRAREQRAATSRELVVEKLARRVIGWDMRTLAAARDLPARGAGAARWWRWRTSSPAPTATSSTAAIRLLGLGPVVGTRTWGGVIGIEGRQRLVDGTCDDRAQVRVLVRRVRLGRGELRRGPGRRGADHPRRLGRGP